QPALIRGRLLGLLAGDEGPRSVAQDGDELVVTEEYGRRRARRFAYGAAPAAIVRLSGDGRWLLIGDRRRVEVWELGAEIRRAGVVDFGRTSDRVGAFAVSPDGRRFAIGTKRGCVLVFSLGAVDR
ncbi:MAG: hypothetical protein JWM10_1547, partial [Myxococcaceae bacterium]|nr:hypothetical protein [Myxococcaceae bacterium]